MNIEELRTEIALRRRQLESLEAELEGVEREAFDRKWYPRRFYTAYYVLSGMVVGLIAAWIVLLLNAVGALFFGERPLELMRVYSTILGGAKSAESADAVVMMFSLGLPTFMVAVCGASIHVVYSRFFAGQTLLRRLFTGVWLVILMLVVNLYGVLSWLQPAIHGETGSYIIERIPIPVAVLTHVAFTVFVLLLQPLAIFNIKDYPGSGEPEASDDTPANSPSSVE